MLRPRYEAQDYGTLKIRNEGFEVVALPPTFHTSSFLLQEGSLLDTACDIDVALETIPLVSRERKEYLRSRRNYWRSQKEDYDNRAEIVALRGGFE